MDRTRNLEDPASVSRIGNLMADNANFACRWRSLASWRWGRKGAKKRIDAVVSGSVRFGGYTGKGLACDGGGRAHKISSGCLRLKLSSVTYIGVFVFPTRRTLSSVDCRRRSFSRARNKRCMRICSLRRRFVFMPSKRMFSRGGGRELIPRRKVLDLIGL